MSRQAATLETSAGGIVVRRPPGDAPVFLLIRDSYRNWGFPKGHVEPGEEPSAAALREVQEETGLNDLRLVSDLQAIDWYFRFRGKLIHKVCHFYLMETECVETSPQRTEGITACRWEPYESALALVSYSNARNVLTRARDVITSASEASTASTGDAA